MHPAALELQGCHARLASFVDASYMHLTYVPQTVILIYACCADLTRAIQTQLDRFSSDAYSSVSLLPAYAAYGKSGAAVIRGVESLEIAKSILASTATGRYAGVIAKAKEDVGFAEAIFGAELEALETADSKIVSAKQRLAKARTEAEDAKSVIASGSIHDDPLINEVVTQATALLAAGERCLRACCVC
jgi:hypothetical protein